MSDDDLFSFGKPKPFGQDAAGGLVRARQQLQTGIQDTGNFRTAKFTDLQGVDYTVRTKGGSPQVTAEKDEAPSAPGKGIPLLLASPRYITDWMDGDTDGRVVYGYKLKTDGPIARKERHVFRGAGAQAVLDQQPGNATWYDSRPADTRQTGKVLSWWSKLGNRMNAHSFEEEDRLNGSSSPLGWNDPSGKWLYIDGVRKAQMPYRILGAALHVDGEDTYVRVVCRGPYRDTVPEYSELKLYEFLLGNGGDSSTWTTQTIHVDVYEVLGNVAPFNADGTKFCYIRDTTADGWELMECEFSTATPARVFQSYRTVSGSSPASTHGNVNTTSSNGVTTEQSETDVWAGNRTDVIEQVIAADYIGMDLAFYYFRETYVGTWSEDLSRSHTATEAETSLGSGFWYPNTEEYTASFDISRQGTKAFKLILNVAGSETTIYEESPWPSMDFTGTYYFLKTVSNTPTGVGSIYTSTVTHYESTLDEVYSKDFKTRLFHAVAADPRAGYFALGIAETNPYVFGSGKYQQTLTVKEIIDSAVVHSESTTYAPAGGFFSVILDVFASSGTSYPTTTAFHVTWSRPNDTGNLAVNPHAAVDLTSFSGVYGATSKPWSISPNLMLLHTEAKDVVLFSGTVACGVKEDRNWPEMNADKFIAGVGSALNFYNASRNDAGLGITLCHHHVIEAGGVQTFDDKPVVQQEAGEGGSPERSWLSSPIYIKKLEITL